MWDIKFRYSVAKVLVDAFWATTYELYATDKVDTMHIQDCFAVWGAAVITVLGQLATQETRQHDFLPLGTMAREFQTLLDDMVEEYAKGSGMN